MTVLMVMIKFNSVMMFKGNTEWMAEVISGQEEGGGGEGEEEMKRQTQTVMLCVMLCCAQQLAAIADSGSPTNKNCLSTVSFAIRLCGQSLLHFFDVSEH